jgi:hypothetical protein
LVRFQTGEKQKRIDTLLKQLRDVSRTRADLETRADPLVRQRLQEKSAQRQRELQAHDAAKPAEVANPSASGYTPGPEQKGLLEELSMAQKTKKSLGDLLRAGTEILRAAERQHAVAKRLLERLENFEKEAELFNLSLTDDAKELGLVAADLASVTINKAGPVAKGVEAAELIRTTRDGIDNEDSGLRKQLADTEATIQGLQAQLDLPSRAYQTYLAALAEWQTRRNAIEGSPEDPESLQGLHAALADLDELPGSNAAAKSKQVELAIQIHAAKLAQAEVYRTLYGPVQEFINSHALAKDRLKLEFRAELTTNAFTERLLGFLALNRRGSFMGIDEGRARAKALLQPIDWEKPDLVRSFLESVDTALHVDQRDGQNHPVLLNDQLLKAHGTKAEDLYGFLYGLEYVRPHYLLRWEGKDLSMLSPGERGTLLLVFYLLVDKSDRPLIIDQPEGNLDNHTVAKVLVDCIKEARKRRQVFIVTHNPNLAVVCDADQVVHASMDKANGNRVTYTSGSLENPVMSQLITDVLEGTRWAFDVRDKKYRVGEQDLPARASGTA